MSPRLPGKKPSTPSSTGQPNALPEAAPVRPLQDAAVLRAPHSALAPRPLDQAHAGFSRLAPDTPARQNAQVTEFADPARRVTDTSLESYRITTTDALPTPDLQGLRISKKRRFVDLEDGGTVMVVYDAQLDIYRAKRSDELMPSGPALYRIGQGNTWGQRPASPTGDHPSGSQPPPGQTRRVDDPRVGNPSRPAPEKAADQRPATSAITISQLTPHYKATYHQVSGPDSQGYYRLKKNPAAFANANESTVPLNSADFPETLFAFEKDYTWVQVDPPSSGVDSSGQSLPPARLAAWTDREIWGHYGLHGNDISRFRAEAATTGRKPQWAHCTSQGRDRERLIQDLKWAYPQKTALERGEILQGYNLLPSMLPRLKQALEETGQIPPWAETHRLESMDETNPQRYAPLESEVIGEIRHIRSFEPHSLDPEFEYYYTPSFLDGFMLRLGYRKNIHGCLYRTDIPALFRSEDRTPFELARDGCMLAREDHAPGSTTKKALSASFSLSNAQGYEVGGGPGAGQLRYNTQRNLYPGKRAESDTGSSYTGSAYDSDNDASSNSSRSLSASDSDAVSSKDSDGDETSQSASSSSSSGPPVSLDSGRGYATLRHRQVTSFIYAIDTRNIEVVPGRENYFFNYRAEGGSFPYDDIEGHVSVSRRGISAERIWLVNSGLTRAAKVRDIHHAAGQTAARIESATWNGEQNSHVYDQLIDQVADSGGQVIDWPADQQVFSDDVVWPPAPT